MTPKCATAIRAAAGDRQISDAKLKAIDDALNSKMIEFARRDRKRWLGLSRDQQVGEALAAAMEEVNAQAARKVELAEKQARSQLNMRERAEAQQKLADGLTLSNGYARELQSVNDYGHAVRNEAVSGLRELIDAGHSTAGTGPLRNLGIRIFGMDNPVMTADVVREVFRLADGSTGNSVAKAAARAWLDTIENLRLRFNAAGGAIGKLGYGYLSQAHDAVKVAATQAQKWATDVLPLLDRQQYLRTDGSLMDNGEVLKLLERAHETIATEGDNKTIAGQFQGSGARANRGMDHRVLHFKDGDAWMAYMSQYGEGSLYDAMIGHVGKMARDIALLERMGPNPAATHRLMVDLARRADGEGTFANRSAGNTPDAYYRIVAGETGTPENRAIARAGSDLRNIETAAKITWGPFSALADIATVMQTLHYNRIPYFDYLKAYKRQLTAEGREHLQGHGVISESLLSSLNRWTGDNLTHSLTGRVASGVMHLSLMNAWTDAGRNAFADVMMHNYTRKLGKSWGQLDEWDRFLMQRKDITEQDWAIISQAKPDPDSPTAFVSGKVIRETGLPGAREAATKWMAFVSDESQFAVVNPDVATRAIATGGGMPAGTVSGEAWRSIAQFKSFPIAMLSRHWRRVFETPQGLEGAPAGFGAESGGGALVNRIAALAALGLTTTILGAIQTQARQVATGKDPIDMWGEHAGKFWGKAWAAGGGAGFLADILMAPVESPMYGWQGKLGALGPVAGSAGGLIDVMQSKHKAAGAVRWTSDQLPFVDMFYTRAMYEHWFLQNAQEALNPGYLRRMQSRAQKEWGQQFWWEPGAAAPERMPAVGGE